MEQMQMKEVISALADGQLQGEAFARGVELATSDSVAQDAWHTYHLIGDVLRANDLARGAGSRDFLARMQTRLAQEAAPLPLAEPVAGVRAGGVAANDENFRWKLVAGFASVAAVAAIGWSLVGVSGGQGAQPQLAAAGGAASTPAATVLANTESGPMIRDPRLDELLAAHRQLGGASALQMPAGFLRNATFETPAR